MVSVAPSSPQTRESRGGLRWVLLLLILTVSVAAWMSAPRLYFDQAWQLIALRDYIAGASSGPNWIYSAIPTDLTQDSSRWILNWPPGYSFLILGLHALTDDLAAAHTLLAWLCVVVGCIGWYRLFASIPGLPPGWQAAGLAIVTLAPPGVYSVVELHPEVFIFATTPWQLWLALRLLDPVITCSKRLMLASALGLVVGFAYWLKYSAALTGIPILAATALMLWRARLPKWGIVVPLLALTAALPVCVLSFYNLANVDGINPTASASYQQAFHPPTALQWLNLASGPFQALAGSEAILSRLLFLIKGPPIALPDFWKHAMLTSLLALLASLPLLYLIVAYAKRSFLLLVAVTANGFVILALIWIWGNSTIASDEARHFTGVSLLWGPVLLVVLHQAWISRRWLGILGMLAVSPALLGSLQHLWGITRASTMLPAAAEGGFRLEPALDLSLLREQVRDPAGTLPEKRVWICFEPRVLFALNGRRICESYKKTAVNYAAQTRTSVVILVPKQPPMNPEVYQRNLDNLYVDLSQPDFTNGDYAGFIRWVGPNGCEPPEGTEAN
jgi:hypothetical protein